MSFSVKRFARRNEYGGRRRLCVMLQGREEYKKNRNGQRALLHWAHGSYFYGPHKDEFNKHTNQINIGRKNKIKLIN